MEIVTAREMGFCFGVRRAVDLALQAAASHRKIQTLGPLVHNAQVAQRLAESGVDVAASLAQVSTGIVVITSHGVSPLVFDEARERGLDIIDATCPMVRSIQVWAEQLSKDGFQVFVFGDAEHAEVQGICGWAAGGATVVSSVSEIDFLPQAGRLALLAQSTQNVTAFTEIARQLINKHLSTSKEVRIFNTICDATAKRQAAAAELARRSNVIIVVGGRDSANTRRLAEVCAGVGAHAYLVEVAADIQADWINGHRTVGITAGASTPDWVIDDVITSLRKM
jgi:4-hydroxy-3-methylbut-2-enyl diphosphate reductase